MKYYLGILIVLFPYFVNAQDVITLRNGDEITCRITAVDSICIFYDFQRGERILSSFVKLEEVRSYHISVKENESEDPEQNSIPKEWQEHVILDTSIYMEPETKWINMLSYSHFFCLHSEGWSIQYYGYVLGNYSRWTFPLIVGYEDYELDMEYFSRFDYYSLQMNYGLAGISPFFRLNDFVYLSLGINFIFGQEYLVDYNSHETNSLLIGFAPSQCIYLIPNSKIVPFISFGLYEKFLSSKIYKNDLGFKLEFGFKF